jgi:short chain dehydrogenase
LGDPKRRAASGAAAGIHWISLGQPHVINFDLTPFLEIDLGVSIPFEGELGIYKGAGQLTDMMFRFRLNACTTLKPLIHLGKRHNRYHFSIFKAASIMASKKIVLVTGGNNGIGYEIVKALLESKNPYHVLLGSRSLEKAKTAIENLHKEVPETASTVEIVQVDLTSDESIEKAFEQVKNNHGYLDVLINNAGMLLLSHPVTLRKRNLTSPRSFLRPRLHSWQNKLERLLQQCLQRERNRHARANLHLYPSPARLQNSLPQPRKLTTPYLRSRSLSNHRRGKELLPHAPTTRGLAEEN